MNEFITLIFRLANILTKEENIVKGEVIIIGEEYGCQNLIFKIKNIEY